MQHRIFGRLYGCSLTKLLRVVCRDANATHWQSRWRIMQRLAFNISMSEIDVMSSISECSLDWYRHSVTLLSPSSALDMASAHLIVEFRAWQRTLIQEPRHSDRGGQGFPERLLSGTSRLEPHRQARASRTHARTSEGNAVLLCFGRLLPPYPRSVI